MESSYTKSFFVQITITEHNVRCLLCSSLTFVRLLILAHVGIFNAGGESGYDTSKKLYQSGANTVGRERLQYVWRIPDLYDLAGYAAQPQHSEPCEECTLPFEVTTTTPASQRRLLRTDSEGH